MQLLHVRLTQLAVCIFKACKSLVILESKLVYVLCYTSHLYTINVKEDQWDIFFSRDLYFQELN